MPAQPTWFHRLDSILAELADCPALLDRRTVERLFGLGARQAQRLMASLDGRRIGTSDVVDRDALTARLLATQSTDRFQWERRRRERVEAKIEAARKALASRRVTIPRPPAAEGLFDLPAGVSLAPGRLTIEFENPVQLIEHLFAVSQAIANDVEAFEKAVSFSAVMSQSGERPPQGS
jgi:hypothetical protein